MMQVGLTMILALGLVAAADNGVETRELAPWTVLIYGGVDSSSEEHILPYLRSVKSLSEEGRNAEVILLYDRAVGHTEDSEVFGENFEDARLFRLGAGKWNRVSGGKSMPRITMTSTYEANTGDARTLKRFIRFGKSEFPAERYLLIIYGHGSCRAVCPDHANPYVKGGRGDTMFVGEMTETMSEDESVDVMWFDVCGFGGIENAYQFRPGNGRFSTKVLLATPPNSSPAPMRHIFKAAGFVGKTSEMPADGLAFGRLMIAKTEKYIRSQGKSDYAHESWGCYDLSYASAAKKMVDELAAALSVEDGKAALENIRGSGDTPIAMNYMGYGYGTGSQPWIAAPNFDLYDLAKRINGHDGFSARVRKKAARVLVAVDQLVVASFGMSDYEGFAAGKNGLFIVFPDGGAMYEGRKQWSMFRWYHPDRGVERRGNYGRLSWCDDGATRDDGVVDNWFELMDSWYDTNDRRGGSNKYRW